MIEKNVRWSRQEEALGYTRVGLADSYWLRLRGLLGRPAPARGTALKIKPCSSVHTCFMGYAIDVVFLDRGGVVVKLASSLKPWRFRVCPGAACVVEFAAGEIQALRLQVGDKCEYC
ncbi:DUF192 domain-containing protein [Gilvimarinus agarilyticus]|uniref:DUF192 domain-containing protein n=1 Tax=Gilvimarinus sp. 2_MG-2023 TaxID=3062666 RepID=UPI001C09EB05|nr:DUF192 domain-containing protein [Gilvimarinus sp. 2_MG-2023]MBU2885278.1 DUF192 domain-containing protein [Gilvimarinus agarilyticus]MDO6570175.1 DUF192 domain-containing protein [Gilvimarinus sp. 2_MG-2023]